MKCSIKGCNKQAKIFLSQIQFCEEHYKQIAAQPYYGNKIKVKSKP